MALTITQLQNEDELRIIVDGEVDVSCANELRDALLDAQEQDAQPVVVDLANVPYIDSTGIGVLVGAARRSKEAGTSFVVTNPQRNVARVLSLLGVGAELGVEGA